MKKLLCILLLTSFYVLLPAQIKVEIGPQFGGPISDDFRSTIGGDLNVKYMVTPQIGVGASIGYHHIIMADNWKEIWYEQWGTDYTEANYNLMPIRATFTYYLSDKSLKPYIGFETGINKQFGSYSYYYDSYYGDVSYDDNKTSFAFAGAVGLEIDLGSSLGIDLNLKYNGFDQSFVSGKFGLVFRFGNK